jgi:hypothetical protein
MNKEDFNFLVECAVKAPSGHNTQPWKFENAANEIIIHPDFKRALPVVDADNYELYISLGCALENMLIAAKQKGYNEEAWIKTGRAFQRFGLITTHLGLSHAHLNMPCEETEIRKKLSEKLNLIGKHPLLLIRYGYADKMPYSFRRNTKDVIA